MSGDECAYFEPKRVQTGWVCRCPRAVCVCCQPGFGRIIDPVCNWVLYKPKWTPFYGKVVE